MSRKLRGGLVTGSAIVALIGAGVSIVYFFQPWRSCDYEDTSAGCAMLASDATVMAVAVFVTVIAMAVFLFTLLAKEGDAVR